MEIVLLRENLLEALNLVSKNVNVGKDPTGIQRYVKIDCAKNRVILNSWNGITMLRTWFTEGVLELSEEGSILIPFDKLFGIAKSSTTKKIKISSSKDTRFVIKANGSSTVNSVPVSEFPILAKDKDKDELIVETTLEKYVKRLDLVQRCTSELETAKEELKAVLWNGEFIATDGSRASAFLGKKIDKEFLIPKNTVSLLVNIYREKRGSSLKISSKGHTLSFRGDNFELTSSLILGSYPNYKVILDKAEKADKKIEFSKDEMRKILGRGIVFECTNIDIGRKVEGAVLLQAKDGKLLVKVGNDESHSEYVKSAKVTEDVSIFIKTEFLKDCVELSQEDTVVLRYTDNHSPMFVQQGKWIYFCVPLRREVY